MNQSMITMIHVNCAEVTFLLFLLFDALFTFKSAIVVVNALYFSQISCKTVTIFFCSGYDY